METFFMNGNIKIFLNCTPTVHKIRNNLAVSIVYFFIKIYSIYSNIFYGRG